MFRYAGGMASVARHIFRLADRVAGTPADASSIKRSRARALVIWTLLAVPIGVLLILLAQDFQPTMASASILAIGATGMFFAVAYLHLTGRLEDASTIFVLSGVVGLGGNAWLEPSPSLVPLIFLAATPVYFGLIVKWQRCLFYTGCLFGFYVCLTLWCVSKPGIEFGDALNILACGFAALGVGLSTTTYASVTERAARKVIRQADEIATIAYKDLLTGISNRRAFKNSLEEVSQDVEFRVLAMIDLDDFKVINDTFGHEVGDQVLVEFAARITHMGQGQSSIYRLGGDEFVFVTETSFAAPDDIGEKICALVATPFETLVGPLPVHLSVGVAAARPGAQTMKQMFRDADTALYEAKRTDGSAWVTYCEGLGSLAARSNRLTELLRQALDVHQIDVAFQPQYDIRDDRIIGFEGLARWTTEEFGPVSPGEFVPIAQRANLVTKLDQTVIKAAITTAGEWLLPDQQLALNVAGSTLLSAGFVDFVDEVVSKSALQHGQIQIEITETEIIENKTAAIEVCHRLHALGVSITLDDFGTGYSSLSYLSSLPVNALKVDRSFVQNCDQESDLKILKSVIGLARSLGLKLVVEGVDGKGREK